MAEPAYVADTNVLLRLTKPEDQDYPLVQRATTRLWDRGTEICYTPQNLAEFWNVATRPSGRNGFGLSIPETDRRVQIIESNMTLLEDNERIHREWRRMVILHSVSGVQVYDARLAAAMRVHGVTHLLTFNTQDFTRFSGITAVHPRDVT